MPVSKQAKTGLSRANTNKAVRQEALRDQLSAQGHVQHVIDICGQLMDLDTELDPIKVARLKATADIKLKLIGKYLPDLKQIEARVITETKIADIKRIRDDLEKIEQGQTIDSTAVDITDDT